MLAHLGWGVQVLEKSCLPDAMAAKSQQRAYHFTLIIRGIRALKLAGVNLQAVLGDHAERLEVKFFEPDGTLSRSASLHAQGQKDPVHLRVIRSELTCQVIKEAQRMHPEAIKIHFNTLVEHVDLKGQTLHASSAGFTNIDKTVLLGDAAHTMHPVLGQGLNVGLEDAMLFVQCLERHGSNVDTALPAFNTERTPDIHAILTINEAVASGMGIASQDQHMAHTLWVWGHRVLLDLHMAVHMLLCSMAPNIFSEPVLVPLEMGTHSKPYRSLTRAIYCDAIVMAAILTSAAACAAHLLQSHLLSG